MRGGGGRDFTVFWLVRFGQEGRWPRCRVGYNCMALLSLWG